MKGRDAVMMMSATPSAWIVRLGLVLLAAGPQQPVYPFNERPADVTFVLSTTSRGRYDGTYHLAEVARICGEVPGELNFVGVPSFIVQLYPETAVGEVQDVTFSSKELVGKVMSSTQFHLSVTVKSAKIGSPPAFVLDTLQPKMTGTATLTTPSAGTTQLKVTGIDDRGETFDMTLVCKPRPPVNAGRRPLSHPDARVWSGAGRTR
jgi:hypothetical protein